MPRGPDGPSNLPVARINKHPLVRKGCRYCCSLDQNNPGIEKLLSNDKFALRNHRFVVGGLPLGGSQRCESVLCSSNILMLVELNNITTLLVYDVPSSADV